MKPEDLMAKIGQLFVERYAELVIKIDDTTDQRSDEAQLKILGRASMEGSRVSAFHAQGQKVSAGLAKLEAEVAKSSAQATLAAATVAAAKGAANENEVETPEEMEMDDDTGRTPERIDALYHEIDRRLAALAARREAKGWGGRNGPVAAGATEGDLASGGGAAPAGPA